VPGGKLELLAGGLFDDIGSVQYYVDLLRMSSILFGKCLLAPLFDHAA
jgi:hypothetical protein